MIVLLTIFWHEGHGTNKMIQSIVLICLAYETAFDNN